MLSGRSVCIVGGGYAARGLAKRLMYDWDVTIISKTLYHLDNHARLDMALGGRVVHEKSLERFADICDLKNDNVEFVKKGQEGKFEVQTDKEKVLKFDQVALAPGCWIGPNSRILFGLTTHNVYTTYNMMQALRMKHNMHKLSKDKLIIWSAGLKSKCVFNAITIALHIADRRKTGVPLSIELHTMDKLLLPTDHQLSVELTKMLQDKGVTVVFGSELTNLDADENIVQFTDQEGRAANLTFDNLIIEPKVYDSPLTEGRTAVDRHTLKSADGVYLLGTALKHNFKLISRDSIDAQITAVSNSLLRGNDSHYHHASRFELPTGLPVRTELSFGEDDRLLFRESRGMWGSALKDTIRAATVRAKEIKEQAWGE